MRFTSFHEPRRHVGDVLRLLVGSVPLVRIENVSEASEEVGCAQ